MDTKDWQPLRQFEKENIVSCIVIFNKKPQISYGKAIIFIEAASIYKFIKKMLFIVVHWTIILTDF